MHSLEKKLVDAIPNAIIVLDEQGNILWWNKTAQLFFALENKKPTRIEQLLESNYFSDYISNKNLQPIEIESPHQAIERLSISIVPYIENQYLLLAHDVTHVHHLEVMRQDFVANVSHELRTPLTVVHGYLETLLNQEVDIKTSKKIFEQMYQQSIRMERLIEDLLLLSRLETELPSHEKDRRVPVAPMLRAICQEANILSGKRQHHIHCEAEENLMIYGFEDELQSAFSNLIFNAVNYTPAHGTVSVKWYKKEGKPCLQVSDTGIGIAAEHIPRITERFYRVDKDRSRASGGTGLGLAIVKHALLRHNAQLKIESVLGKGSTFSCLFSEERKVDNLSSLTCPNSNLHL